MIRQIKDITLFKPTLPGSTACYLLSYQGAQKLLHINQQVKWHIDAQIAYSTTFKNMIIYASYPYLAVASYEDSSTSSFESFLISKLFNFKINPNHPTVAWILSENIIYIPIITVSINGTDLLLATIFWQFKKNYPSHDVRLFIVIFLLIDSYILGKTDLCKVIKKIIIQIALSMLL